MSITKADDKALRNWKSTFSQMYKRQPTKNDFQTIAPPHVRRLYQAKLEKRKSTPKTNRIATPNLNTSTLQHAQTVPVDRKDTPSGDKKTPKTPNSWGRLNISFKQSTCVTPLSEYFKKRQIVKLSPEELVPLTKARTCDISLDHINTSETVHVAKSNSVDSKLYELRQSPRKTIAPISSPMKMSVDPSTSIGSSFKTPCKTPRKRPAMPNTPTSLVKKNFLFNNLERYVSPLKSLNQSPQSCEKLDVRHLPTPDKSMLARQVKFNRVRSWNIAALLDDESNDIRTIEQDENPEAESNEHLEQFADAKKVKKVTRGKNKNTNFVKLNMRKKTYVRGVKKMTSGQFKRMQYKMRTSKMRTKK